MKKVFEGVVFKEHKNIVRTTEAFEYFYQGLPQNKRVRITVEELPESKPEVNKYGCESTEGRWIDGTKPLPEPEKNCGNCGRYTSFCCPTLDSPADNYTCWRKKEQPKPAEPQSEVKDTPQGWEQRFNKQYEGCDLNDLEGDIKDFIRAEIERVREEAYKMGYNRACEEYGPIARAQGEQIGKNKHREAK